MSDGDKAFWGSIIGAFIGTLGALLVGLFAVVLDRYQQRKRDQRKALQEYNRNLILVDVSLNEILPALFKNKRLLANCESETPGNFQVTLPRIVEARSVDVGDLQNEQLSNEWLTFITSSKIVNQMIEDFLESYKGMRQEVFGMIIRGDRNKMDQKYVVEEQATLDALAGHVKQAVIGNIEDALSLLAIAHLHAEVGKSKSTKFKRTSQLYKFELPEDKIKAKAESLKQHFNDDMFTDV